MFFVLASNNEGKLREMRDILSGFGIDVLSQKEAGVLADVEETGETFYENAYLKAQAAVKASRLPAIADDSGLCVDSLGGGPGVRSKRYGGDGLDDAGRNALMLEALKTEEHRQAKFVSSIVCIFPDGGEVSAEWICHGEILRAPRGGRGFGYDPIFLVSGTGRSMAELTESEKNDISHRGAALRAFIPKLRAHLAGGQSGKDGGASC